MKALSTLARIIVFIILTSWNFEYLVNRESDTLLFVLALAVEVLLFWLLIRPLILPFIKSSQKTEK